MSETAPSPESVKLSVGEKLGYSLGDCAANFVFQTQLIFLMNFYTDVFGISAAVAGWIFFGSRMWDAINDPMIGGLSDRTRTRWGRFRPWVLFTAVPFGVFFVLAYTTPDLSTTGKIIWAVVTYNALMMIYTANNIPYSALSGVMTADPQERTSLSSWRFFFAMLAGFFVATFTVKLVEQFGGGNEAVGYQRTIAFWAVIAVIFFVITFLTTRERVQPDPQQASSIRQDIADLFANRNWIALAWLIVFVFIYLAMRGSVTKYYFDYYIQRQDGFAWDPIGLTPFAWFNALTMVGSLLGILFSKPISSRLGKPRTVGGCLLIVAVTTYLFIYLPPDALGQICVLQFCMQVVYGVTIPLLWAMMADVADDTEWKTGRRATGMTFATCVFALKLGLSIGGLLCGKVLQWYEYVPNAVQSERALEGIRLLMSIFPAIAFVIGIVALLAYGIGTRHEAEMHLALTRRRSQYGQDKSDDQ